ncbi:hypothetical protein [Photobacterium galatheae]|uniref:Yip1 domain-containing protein n=1 Tax=Photobacterium galatheae TaxID=1654360 RepID=A0A066RTI7_9GAMM|nr:hypothetical protein [Photobacterium galatheae]KDM91022.1 hypothetical protein EA58_14835 [Photobacterium galatheae]MCM0149026.1 hypothetical protein [Photobacterium galatheae]
MNAMKGFLKPTSYFRHLVQQDGKAQVDNLLKKVIFIVSFFSILAYLSVSNFGEKIGLANSGLYATKAATDAALWALCTFFIHGLIAAVVGKLFRVDERVSGIVTCFFWSHFYGWITGISAFVISYTSVYLLSDDVELSLLISFVPFVLIKIWYLIKGAEISMQTSKLESTAIVFLSLVLVITLKWCLNEATNQLFENKLIESHEMKQKSALDLYSQ